MASASTSAISEVELTTNPTPHELFDETNAPPLDEYAHQQSSQHYVVPAYDFQKEFRERVICRDVATIKALVSETQVNVNQRDAAGNSALMDAAETGNAEMVKTLLTVTPFCCHTYMIPAHHSDLCLWMEG